MQKKIDSQKVTPTRAALSPGPKHYAVAPSTYSLPLASPAETIAPLPRQICPENLPEVAVELVSPISPRSFSNISIRSGLDSSRFDLPQKRHGWHSIFKSNRSLSTSVSLPSYTFFSCGKSLLLWNERGSGFYDLRDLNSISFRRISSSNVHIAAGGMNTCGIVDRTETVSVRHFANLGELTVSRVIHCRYSMAVVMSPSISGGLKTLHSRWLSHVMIDILH